MITKVTITGADDSIKPVDLVSLLMEFNFLEAGILVSSSNYNTPRFPSLEWIDKLCKLVAVVGDINLSLHACGKYVRDLVEGRQYNLFIDLYPNLDYFQRIQLNTHNIKHGFSADFVKLIQLPILNGKEFIFQYDDANYKVVRQIAENADAKCSILFDKSGGNGILPNEWPELLPGLKCGYAGGLGPENLKEQIELIEEKAGDTEIWIDMETLVRSDNDRLFDLEKVRKCLEIAQPYIR